jgi:acyl-coenzyme A synthetase/AMP-(fatty) acid ligase
VITRLTGLNYADLVNLYSVSRAGFVPQVFSIKFSPLGVSIINDLLTACDGKALIYDPSFNSTSDVRLPSSAIPSLGDMRVFLGDNVHSLPDLPDRDPLDFAMVFHTSGTTNGKPKPVQCSHRWMVRQAELARDIWQGSFDTPNVMNNLGSFAHVGTATCE